MIKKIIHTDLAPQAIGPYSQAICVGDTVYLSGQIPLVPSTMEIVAGDFKARVHQVFLNLREVAIASGGTLADVVKLGIYLTDLNQFSVVNDVMREYFQSPYPARSTVQVAALPKWVDVEVDAIMVLSEAL
jgi:reactive intermediate/imine deaminase